MMGYGIAKIVTGVLTGLLCRVNIAVKDHLIDREVNKLLIGGLNGYVILTLVKFMVSNKQDRECTMPKDEEMNASALLDGLKEAFDNVMANPMLLANEKNRQLLIDQVLDVFAKLNKLNKGNIGPEQERLNEGFQDFSEKMQGLFTELQEKPKPDNLPPLLNAILKLVELILNMLGFTLTNKEKEADSRSEFGRRTGPGDYINSKLAGDPLPPEPLSPERAAANAQKDAEYKEWSEWTKKGNDPEYNARCDAIESHYDGGNTWAEDDAYSNAADISIEKFKAYKRGVEDASTAIQNGTADKGPDVNNAGTYKLPYANEEDRSHGQTRADEHTSEGVFLCTKRSDEHTSRVNKGIKSGYEKGFEDAMREHQASQSPKMTRGADTGGLEIHTTAKEKPAPEKDHGKALDNDVSQDQSRTIPRK